MKRRKRRHSAWILILGVLFAYPCQAVEEGNAMKENRANKSLTITILYDNYRSAEGTVSDWGFSCLVRYAERTILFDTGTDPDILMKNVSATGTDLSEVEIIIISHNHGDHTGGLNAVLKKTKNPDLYMPFSTPGDFQEPFAAAGASVHNEKAPFKIVDKVYLTGELGDQIKEQALVLDTEKGLVIITGCSHPGIVHIVSTAKSHYKRPIHMVLGGFHLMRHSDAEVAEVISELKALGVQKCGASHCTGGDAIDAFRAAFGNDFVDLGSGRVIKISTQSPPHREE